MGYLKMYDSDARLIRKVCGVKFTRETDSGKVFALELKEAMQVYCHRPAMLTTMEYFDGEYLCHCSVPPSPVKGDDFVTLAPASQEDC